MRHAMMFRFAGQQKKYTDVLVPPKNRSNQHAQSVLRCTGSMSQGFLAFLALALILATMSPMSLMYAATSNFRLHPAPPPSVK